ncbi:natriuretic peptides B [Lagenorhynchus albirostris]|uniref:natriuretic peptides B n=1 Tax=Lagenorhynchus albirostris TaxID=27610 RepID=UPI0028EA84A2|nr:natriuretic peptides B [Lagenorhynchus albirostris]
MDPQTTLPRALMLILFLHLSLPRCRSYPLGGPGPASELRGIQELLGRLRGRVLELQAEQMDLDPLQQGHGLAEAWETRAAAPAGLLGPGNSVLQALRGIRSPRMMRDSGCFGRRLDRIGSLSGLGCNGKWRLQWLIPCLALEKDMGGIKGNSTGHSCIPPRSSSQLLQGSFPGEM